MRKLNRGRFDSQVACMKQWGQFLADIEHQQIPVSEYRINSLYKPAAFRQLIRLAMDMRRQRIQIVHSYNFYGNMFALPAARLARVPVIIASIRDTGMGMTPLRTFVHKQVCRLADRILVNAEAIRESLVANGAPARKITVIRNGLELSQFDRPADSSALRQELGLPESAPIVLLLARLTPQKGMETFLDAAAIVHRRCPDAHFVVVGDAFVSSRDNYGVERDVSYRDVLINKAERLGIGSRVQFTGYRRDVPALLKEVALSVLPSHSGEGLPNALMESMAAGVPVVATQVGGSPEVIGVDGVAGLLVPPRDAAALAQAMCRVLENRHLAERLAQAGKRRMNALFSVERMVRETEELYVSMLEQAPRRRGSRDHFGR
jgi:L-malate glycosyltransferase